MNEYSFYFELLIGIIIAFIYYLILWVTIEKAKSALVINLVGIFLGFFLVINEALLIGLIFLGINGINILILTKMHIIKINENLSVKKNEPENRYTFNEIYEKRQQNVKWDMIDQLQRWGISYLRRLPVLGNKRAKRFTLIYDVPNAYSSRVSGKPRYNKVPDNYLWYEYHDEWLLIEKMDSTDNSPKNTNQGLCYYLVKNISNRKVQIVVLKRDELFLENKNNELGEVSREAIEVIGLVIKRERYYFNNHFDTCLP